MGCRCHDHKFDPLDDARLLRPLRFLQPNLRGRKRRGGQANPALDIATDARTSPLEEGRGKSSPRIVKEVDGFEQKRYGKPPGNRTRVASGIGETARKASPSFSAARRRTSAAWTTCWNASSSSRRLKDGEYAGQLEKLLAALRGKTDAANMVTKVMVMDTVPKPRDTFVLVKGAYDKPNGGEGRRRRVPASLPQLAADAPTNRLGLAQWLVSPRESAHRARHREPLLAGSSSAPAS